MIRNIIEMYQAIKQLVISVYKMSSVRYLSQMLIIHQLYFLPSEILKRVQEREFPPFRPDVSGADCPHDIKLLMDKCWLDSPEDRPTFETIKSDIRTIMKGYCENLMDDLLRRMEQYANNLEVLVEEKTEQLSQEKRRSEELLYQVLPR